MRRVIFFFISLFVAKVSFAQFYVGGYAGLTVGNDVTTPNVIHKVNTKLTIQPEAGYIFNKYISAGCDAGYNACFETDQSSFFISPYLRFTLPISDHFSLFTDILCEKEWYLNHLAVFSAGLSPGIKIPVTDKWGITNRLAFLRYHSYNISRLDRMFCAELIFLNGPTTSIYFIL